MWQLGGKGQEVGVPSPRHTWWIWRCQKIPRIGFIFWAWPPLITVLQERNPCVFLGILWGKIPAERVGGKSYKTAVSLSLFFLSPIKDHFLRWGKATLGFLTIEHLHLLPSTAHRIPSFSWQWSNFSPFPWIDELKLLDSYTLKLYPSPATDRLFLDHSWFWQDAGPQQMRINENTIIHFCLLWPPHPLSSSKFPQKWAHSTFKTFRSLKV